MGLELVNYRPRTKEFQKVPQSGKKQKGAIRKSNIVQFYDNTGEDERMLKELPLINGAIGKAKLNTDLAEKYLNGEIQEFSVRAVGKRSNIWLLFFIAAMGCMLCPFVLNGIHQHRLKKLV